MSGPGFKAGTYALSGVQARPATPTAATAARRTAVPTRTPPRSRWASVTPRSARSPTTTSPISLTLDKIVVNDNGGTAGRVRVDPDGQRWRGRHPVGPGAAGSTDVVSGTGFKAGTYALSASPARPATPTAATAARRTAAPTRTPPRSRWASVTSAVCKITNDDKVPSLTLNKIVVNDNGGTRRRVRVDPDGQRWRGTAPCRVPVLRAARTW